VNQGGSSARRALALTVACLALFAAPVQAATIQLTITATPVVAADGVHLRLEIRNTGDTAARNVQPIVVFRGNDTLGTFVVTLEPKQSLTQTVVLPLGDATVIHGTWPFFVRVAYGDGNNHPFEALHVAGIRFDSTQPVSQTVAAVSMTLIGARISTTGEVTTRIQSTISGNASVSVIVPAGLAVTPEQASVFLTPGSKTLTTFVTNAGATVSSRLPVFAVTEYESNGEHATAISSAIVEIAPEGERYQEWILPTVIGGLVVVWVAFVFVRQRRRPSASSGFSQRMNVVLTVLGVLVPTLLVASTFPAALLFAETTATGGDLGSHNYAASVARELLLGQHRLTGWVPGNYCGFPLFQIYFPLPFVVSTAVSLFVSPQVAFKLTSVAGVVALPAAAFFFLAARKVPFPGPALAASMTLPFLFQAGNSAWGGNLQSTMAGEFAFSISLPIALVYLGIHDRVFDSLRWAMVGAIIIALLALTHAYTVLWVAMTVALAIPLHPRPYVAAWRTAVVVGLGGALCAFWLVPLLWYSPWTTAFKHQWVIGSIHELLPFPLWPAILVSVLGLCLLWRMDREERTVYWRHTGLPWIGAVTAALAYTVAPNFGVVDIRFLPFAQLAVSMVAAATVGSRLRRWPLAGIAIPVAIAAVTMLTQHDGRRIESWVRWNYEGFERRTLWPVLSGVAGQLRGTAADPRVVYEHSPDNEALGTIRAFENLPLFSGRSTLEGVNLQASVTAPFVFYIQSEVSEVMSCPFDEWGCSRPNLASGLEHLAMMNVSDFIVRSTMMKEAASRQPALTRTGTYGPYEIYHLAAPSGYVVPLERRPYIVVTNDWKVDAYKWFKRARASDPVPLFVRDASMASGVPAAGIFDALPSPDAVRREPLAAATLTERVDAEHITVRGCVPGAPLLIRVSYHPRWRTTTGERVWLAGPGFMLVFPTHDELKLVYGDAAAPWAGQIVTLVSLAGVVVVLLVARPPARRTEGPVAPTPTRAVPSRWPRIIAVGVCVSCGLVAVGTGVRARRGSADALYLRGLSRMDRGQTEEATALFQRARVAAPLSNTAIHSSYFEAVTLFRARRWADSRRAFSRLVDRFPEAQAAPESLYHVGLCDEQLGEMARAAHAFAETERRFPGSSWAQLAATRRAKIEGA